MTDEVQLEKPKADRFAAARAAKAAKKAAAIEAAKNFGLPESAAEIGEDIDSFSIEEKVWLAGLTSAMRAREVKAAADVAVCIPVADAVLKAFKEKFPE